MANQVAIVTGGANGIGKATVTRFLQEGAKVVVADFDEIAGQQLAQSLYSESVYFIQVDVSNRDSVEEMVSQAISHFGTVDILINNAGITKDATLQKMTAMIPLQRIGKPEDIANAYLFLASGESDYVHGHVLHVDGAIVM